MRKRRKEKMQLFDNLANNIANNLAHNEEIKVYAFIRTIRNRKKLSCSNGSK